MELVAEHLARVVVSGSDRLGDGPPAGWIRRPTRVAGSGDIVTMLLLPPSQTLFPSEEITVSTVLAADGRAWRPDPSAEILLLGDSFTNVSSSANLGWGSAAGLAEQLSFFLDRPVDRIALNAGGAAASRRALLEAIRTDPDRLTTKRVVVYQFATRELTGGDWPILPLPTP